MSIFASSAAGSAQAHLLDHLVCADVNVRGGLVQANDFVVLQ